MRGLCTTGAGAVRVVAMSELTALSPSRANDFHQCPLKFRFRSIDKIPEPPSAVAFRGTLVHAVLEKLFDAVANERTLDQASALIRPVFDQLYSEDVSELFPTEADREKLFSEAQRLVSAYFALELPHMLQPAAREEFVTAVLPGGLTVRGIIDRVDRAPAGQVRLVDYKTGKEPRPQYFRDADFQMRFYALVHYLTQGELVHTLRLMYLGSSSIKEFRPTMADLERTYFDIESVWNDITACVSTGNFPPRTSALCNWCHFQALCPAWGNEAPPMPPITELAKVEPGLPDPQVSDQPDSQ